MNVHIFTQVVLYHLESTGIKEATAYAGMVYYEEKGVEDLVTFTVAKDLDALLHVSVSSLMQDNYIQ